MQKPEGSYLLNEFSSVFFHDKKKSSPCLSECHSMHLTVYSLATDKNILS